jgi:hypothetical protein
MNPPDSISDFFKTYLHLKGFHIVQHSEMMNLWQAYSKSVFAGSQNLQNKMSETMNKFGNILILNLTGRIDSDKNYLIESIRWKTWDFPIKDTPAVFTSFTIKDFIKGSNTLILMALADSIMLSKVLF